MSFANQRTWGALAHGQQSVTTAGTAEALNGGTQQAVPNGATLTIRADSGNAGNIYVGDSSVTSSNGYVLSGGDSTELRPGDVADVSIDSDNNGEGVSWIVEVEA